MWHETSVSVGDVLTAALPGASVDVDGDVVTVRLPGHAKRHRFRVASWEGAVGHRKAGPPVLYLLPESRRADVDPITTRGASCVTADGRVVSLRAPGLYVEVRGERPRGDADRVRNPFTGRGLGVGLVMLLEPRAWRVTEVAGRARVSASFASRVLAGLRDEGLVTTEAGAFRAIREPLFEAMAREWPRPRSFFAGSPPGVGDAVVGGRRALEEHGIAVGGRTRIYAATRDQLRFLAALSASVPSPAPVADWEAVVLPLPLENGIVPPVVVALELAGDPRGRETIREAGLVDWDLPG